MHPARSYEDFDCSISLIRNTTTGIKEVRNCASFLLYFGHVALSHADVLKAQHASNKVKKKPKTTEQQLSLNIFEIKYPVRQNCQYSHNLFTLQN